MGGTRCGRMGGRYEALYARDNSSEFEVICEVARAWANYAPRVTNARLGGLLTDVYDPNRGNMVQGQLATLSMHLTRKRW
jgi:hypothetical protein